MWPAHQNPREHLEEGFLGVPAPLLRVRVVIRVYAVARIPVNDAASNHPREDLAHVPLRGTSYSSGCCRGGEECQRSVNRVHPPQSYQVSVRASCRTTCDRMLQLLAATTGRIFPAFLPLQLHLDQNNWFITS